MKVLIPADSPNRQKKTGGCCLPVLMFRHKMDFSVSSSRFADEMGSGMKGPRSHHDKSAKEVERVGEGSIASRIAASNVKIAEPSVLIHPKHAGEIK